MGKMLHLITPDFSNGAIGAVVPAGKIKIIPEGQIGSVRRANYDPFV